mmetsp:Transcript_71662/g.171126  ORF Transcript_71662/g.171126 Transcript_71662/m.171126 type:complete len:254 (-) Transcript_71662:701-1462(-)
MHGALVCQLGVGPLVASGHCVPQRRLGVGHEDGARGALVSTAEHALADHARNSSSNIDHCLKLRPGDLIFVSQADAVPAEDGANLFDVALGPGLHHRLEALLRKEQILKSLAQIWVSVSILRDDLVVSLAILNVTKALNLVPLLLQHGHELIALLDAHRVGGLLEPMAHRPRVQGGDAELVGVDAQRHVGHLVGLGIVACAHPVFRIVDHNLVQIAARCSDVVILHLLCHLDHSEVALRQGLLVDIQHGQHQI